MAKGKNKTPNTGNTIALNKRSRFEYHLEQRFEAGIALQGWEVKALRAARVNFDESYVLLKNGEAFLIGLHINPLPTASTHVVPEPTRLRKLLLHREELSRIFGARDRQGYTVVPTAMYWKKGMAKVEIALAKGKKLHDKRATERERDWNRQKQRILKS